MAQQSNKRQPVYSADTLALRYLGGLALVACGVMMFLAVELRLPGNVFEALRQVCFGLTGGLAAALPLIPVWAGVLVIWSSQRRAPVKPFAYAFLAFLSLCAFVVLVTRIGTEEYLDVLSGMSDGSWGGVILQGYTHSIQLEASGGALGIILAYPLWTLTGTILSAIVFFALITGSILLAVNLTPARIRNLAAGGISFRGGRGKDQAERDQRQIAFQQEQERQRQMAFAQQQAYILQQQQQEAQAARKNSGKTDPQFSSRYSGRNLQDSRAAGQRTADIPGRGWTGTQPPVTDNSVLDWQQQLTNQRASEKSGGKSRIFGKTDSRETARADSRIFDMPREQKELTGVSRIFGRKKDQENDGLSDLSETQKRKEGMAYPGSERFQVSPAERRPVKDENPRSGGVSEASPVSRELSAGERRNQRIRAEQEQVEMDLNRWREPDAMEGSGEEAPVRTGEKAAVPGFSEMSAEVSDGEIRNRTEQEATEPDSRRRPSGKEAFREETAGRAGEKSRKQPPERPGPRSWMDQVLAAENAGKDASGDTDVAMKDRGENVRGKNRTEQVAVPVVQESVKDPTWKPELKRVEPKKEEPEEEFWEPTPYYAPPITDLKKPETEISDTSAEDAERSLRLEETLASFKVQARVVHVTHGPSISRFEMELAAGTKVGKVAELEKDIAYGMQATSVRIEAPIPGKSLVGVEVPNPRRATVTLREVLESTQMQNAKSILTVALDKDIAGTPVICDLAKMPHMLIAGATGSGKSVCINTIINSLLFRAGPEEVRLILVDPKVVELQCYNGIPHLLLPVVNDPHKASAALAWAVAEMMERYDRFSERGVRNLEGYNGILNAGEKPMPRIVIIIDELADLMMVCKKDVEEYICRLTQLARAAGIHLIVATQRPSVDVITGLIKANIPSRIAFKTASSVDSRTILDRNGSEQLLGWGDMLYLPTGSFAPTRIQGCFLSDEEVNRIADHVRQANPSTYDPDILDKLEQLTKGQDEGPGMDLIGGAADSGPGDTDLFEQAVEYAIADGQISTSTLQRRLKVGYARAGRLTDEMEERGIVSAKDGSKPRKCLITREQWEEMKAVSAAG